MQGLGRKVQPGATFKQSWCLCPQTASLNSERGCQLPATWPSACCEHPRAPLPPNTTSPRHRQHPWVPKRQVWGHASYSQPHPHGHPSGECALEPSEPSQGCTGGCSQLLLALYGHFRTALAAPSCSPPQSGSGAGSQGLACLLPVNFFPSGRPARGLCTVGMVGRVLSRHNRQRRAGMGSKPGGGHQVGATSLSAGI